jgi:hypothetical protein
MECSICSAAARTLETSFHGLIVNCVECGSYVIAFEVLKAKEANGRTVAVNAMRTWLLCQRLQNCHRPIIDGASVRWAEQSTPL